MPTDCFVKLLGTVQLVDCSGLGLHNGTIYEDEIQGENQNRKSIMLVRPKKRGVMMVQKFFHTFYLIKFDKIIKLLY